mmetsp:Transcript_5791/g.10379  ORF Transcript_5791/g.10379 Transcript_5791/m.10379 type:complete len:549 (+) Transcript_5791:75-1721(+)
MRTSPPVEDGLREQTSFGKMHGRSENSSNIFTGTIKSLKALASLIHAFNAASAFNPCSLGKWASQDHVSHGAFHPQVLHRQSRLGHCFPGMSVRGEWTIDEGALAESDDDVERVLQSFESRQKKQQLWEYHTQTQQLVKSSREGNSNHFVVPEDLNSARVDAVLDVLLPQVSHTREGQEAYIASLLAKGRVSINSKAVINKATRVTAGSTISVHPRTFLVTAEPTDIKVLHEDDALIAINKPSGMVVHPDENHRSGTFMHALAHHVEKQLPSNEDSADSLRGAPKNDMRLGLVQRLDQDTTGVMLISKTLRAQHQLINAFMARHVHKIYLAVVEGRPARDLTVVTEPIGRYSKLNKYRVVRDPSQGQTAVTSFHCLASVGDLSLVAIRMGTGRTHQIRVHAQHLKCPVLGDPLYSRSAPSSSLMLHAFLLQLPHPISGKQLLVRDLPTQEFVHIAAEVACCDPASFEEWLRPRIADFMAPDANREYDVEMKKLMEVEATTKQKKPARKSKTTSDLAEAGKGKTIIRKGLSSNSIVDVLRRKQKSVKKR